MIIHEEEWGRSSKCNKCRQNQTTINVFSHKTSQEQNKQSEKNGLMIIHINQKKEITESKYYRSVVESNT